MSPFYLTENLSLAIGSSKKTPIVASSSWSSECTILSKKPTDSFYMVPLVPSALLNLWLINLCQGWEPWYFSTYNSSYFLGNFLQIRLRSPTTGASHRTISHFVFSSFQILFFVWKKIFPLYSCFFQSLSSREPRLIASVDFGFRKQMPNKESVMQTTSAFSSCQKCLS